MNRQRKPHYGSTPTITKTKTDDFEAEKRRTNEFFILFAFLLFSIAIVMVHFVSSSQVDVDTSTIITTSTSSSLHSSLFAKLEHLAFKYDVGIWVGVKTKDFNDGYAFGYSDLENKVPAQASQTLMGGSITKTTTTISIMRLVEKGDISLHVPAYRYVNQFLKITEGYTLQELFGEDSLITQVTIDHLLGMKSGIQDYDDKVLFDYTLNHPQETLTPKRLWTFVNTTMACVPGTCTMYSGMNPVILGYILCQYYGLSSYDQLSQHATAFETGTYQETLFVGDEPCSNHETIPRLYSLTPNGYIDASDFNCLNGWTMGNIAISTKDCSSLFYDLFNNQILSPWSVFSMTDNMQPLDIGWNSWNILSYGYSIMKLKQVNYPRQNETEPMYMNMYGHIGRVYGGYMIGGYNPTLDIGMAFGLNKDFFPDDAVNIDLLFCVASDVIIQTLYPNVKPGDCDFYLYNSHL